MRGHRRQAPPWWPANEPWPPRHGSRFGRRRRFFLVRMAIFFAIVLGFSAYGGVSFVGTIVGRGWATPAIAGALWPLLFVVVLPLLFLLMMSRVGRPLNDVVSAADRVAAGDLAVRVREHGPPWLRSVAAAFNSMTARLERQQRQRRDLMADIAHELRTPLSVVQGRLEGMLDGVYPRDEQQVRELLDDTRMLSRLIDDLRTLAHSESGTLTLQPEPTDLGQLLDEVVGSFRREAEQGRVAIRINSPSGLPMIEIDPMRVREVMANLLSNALRHAPPGSTLSIAVEKGPDTVVVRVHDEGEGISAEELPHIFERFYKSAASRGSGLGLTIARHLVTLHGGTIAAESQAGKGTTIVVALPWNRPTH